MKTLHTAALGMALSLGMVTAAQAAAYDCAYSITSGPDQGSGRHYVADAIDNADAVNQTIRWIYATFGPVGFRVQCFQQ